MMQARDKIIPWYFVMFFAFIALVDGVMVTLAVRTHTGVVTQHPYEEGLAYNKVVEAEQQQEAMGWKGGITYADGKLRFVLHDRDNHLLVPEKMVATVTRPTQDGMDFRVDMAGAETPVAFPAKGLWEVRVDAVYQGIHYQRSQRVVVE